MTQMQAALLRSRLRHLEEETERRFRNGRRLTGLLAGMRGVRPLDPEPGDGDRRAYHLYPVWLDREALGGPTRARFMEALAAEGIPSTAGYERPVYRNAAFLESAFKAKGCPVSCGHYGGVVDYGSVSCPAAEEMSESCLWLFHPLLLGRPEEVDDIARALEKVCGHCGELARA
jgi:dTDP-4-amino-4,6-dideoxygalactose transaminase